MKTNTIVMLREIANDLDRDRVFFARALTLLHRLTGACPWELDAGGMPEFWSAMRGAQRLLKEIEENEEAKQ